MSTEKTDPLLLGHAREMRHKMTRQECHLWFDFLQSLPLTVRRQKVFGPYIVDFYIAARKLAIELDGSQHFEPAKQEYDACRDSYLRSLGLTVLRYANSDVDSNFQGVCEDILQHLTYFALCCPLRRIVPPPAGEQSVPPPAGELQVPAACGGRRGPAISAAAPLADRRSAGPGTAIAARRSDVSEADR